MLLNDAWPGKNFANFSKTHLSFSCLYVPAATNNGETLDFERPIAMLFAFCLPPSENMYFLKTIKEEACIDNMKEHIFSE